MKCILNWSIYFLKIFSKFSQNFYPMSQLVHEYSVFLSFLAFISTCQPAHQREDSLSILSPPCSIPCRLDIFIPSTSPLALSVPLNMTWPLELPPNLLHTLYNVHSPLVTVTSQSLILDASCLMYILYIVYVVKSS